jgi:hypothetical protein
MKDFHQDLEPKKPKTKKKKKENKKGPKLSSPRVEL